MFVMTTTTEVILCTTCNGKGVTTYDETTDYHKRESITHVIECKRCNGSGRLKKKTVITFEPFVTPPTGIF
jgi:DnaJ-class molecular chaperone